MPIKIAPELSAIASSSPPNWIGLTAPSLAADGDVVADVGCGYAQGTRELMRHHSTTYAVDTPRQYERVKGRLQALQSDPRFGGFMSSEDFAESRLQLDGAYLVNVLHVLPSAAVRVALLRTVVRNLGSHGFVVIGVPKYEHYYAKRMTTKNAFGDGYVFTRPGGKESTFYRLSTADDTDEWAAAAGLSFDRHVTVHHHVVRIYRCDLGG